MKLGVIGGLGPIATVYFYELIVNMTDASCDQEHLDAIIYNAPSIPDRTKFILGESTANPVVPMIDIGRKLAAQDCDFIAIPCITAQYFHKELSDSIAAPIINTIREVALYLSRSGIRKVGIAATDGTISSKLFQKEFDRLGMVSIVPTERNQRKVMQIIYDNIKAGLPVDMDEFNEVADELKKNGAEVIVLGCTELSLIKRDNTLAPGFIDAMEVLAKVSIESCGYSVKHKYTNLIT